MFCFGYQLHVISRNEKAGEIIIIICQFSILIKVIFSKEHGIKTCFLTDPHIKVAGLPESVRQAKEKIMAVLDTKVHTELRKGRVKLLLEINIFNRSEICDMVSL